MNNQQFMKWTLEISNQEYNGNTKELLKATKLMKC